MKIIVGVDQATTSGAAIIHPGAPRPTWWRATKKHNERTDVLKRAIDAAGGDPRQVHMVFEDHGKMKLTRGTRADRSKGRRRPVGVDGQTYAVTRGTPQILGMGAQRGRWEEQCDMLGIPASHHHAVEPNVWRGRVLGPRYRVVDGETAKRVAVHHCSILLFEELFDELSHDVAEACCIAVYAALWLPAHLEQERLQARAKREARRVG